MPCSPAADGTACARRIAAGLTRLARALVFGLLVVALCLHAVAHADTQQERRVRTGARLMLALLAADVELEAKAAGSGALEVVVYGRDARLRAAVAQTLKPEAGEAPAVRGLSLALSERDREPDDEIRPLALFLAAPVEAAELDRLIAWSIRHRVILYSPFEGDVERGALAGLSIEAKVLPLLNRHTLEASGIRLKPFFVKVAKVVP